VEPRRRQSGDRHRSRSSAPTTSHHRKTACAFSSIGRGLSKAKLKITAWPRELSPSTELRKWYHHEPSLFAEFRRRYAAELAQHKDQLDALRTMVRGSNATLITATRELDLSHATVLRAILQAKK